MGSSWNVYVWGRPIVSDHTDARTQTAEAYISLANVSHPRNNEKAYQKALHLLRRASNIDGYVMDKYLEEYDHRHQFAVALTQY
jgi:hypothetical protein